MLIKATDHTGQSWWQDDSDMVIPSNLLMTLKHASRPNLSSLCIYSSIILRLELFNSTPLRLILNLCN